MSYLTLHALRRPASIRRARRGARVDEETLLNHPDFDGGAHVRVFVEDTSAHRVRRRSLPSPRLKLRITDCTSEIHLEFSVDSPALRENSEHKIETLHRRARALPRRARGRVGASRAARARLVTRKGDVMSYLKRIGTRRVPQSTPIPGSGQVPNSAGGFAWAVDEWTRLRRFLVLGSEGGSYYASRARRSPARTRRRSRAASRRTARARSRRSSA